MHRSALFSLVFTFMTLNVTSWFNREVIVGLKCCPYRSKHIEPARIRTWNLLIRSQARYPLRHRSWYQASRALMGLGFWFIRVFLCSQHGSIAPNLANKKVCPTAKKQLENPGIDPGTSHMLSERSTIWASPPLVVWDFKEPIGFWAHVGSIRCQKSLLLTIHMEKFSQLALRCP